MNTSKRFPESRAGQTLVEALVALTVLTTGFVGIVTLLAKSFQLNRITSEQTQATYLAEEGIEITKNLIDHDLYAGFAVNSSTNAWAATFSQSGYYTGIDFRTQPSDVLYVGTGVPSDVPLQMGPPNGAYPNMYGYSLPSGKNTDFVRTIQVNSLYPNGITKPVLQVIATVKWSNGVLGDSVTLEDYFYDWHP